MEHTEAMSSNAAERYLLGELTETEADTFEDHFFECRACGEEIREGTRMLEVLREVVREDRKTASPVVVPFEQRLTRRAWLPAAVAAVLVVGFGLWWIVPRPTQQELTPLYLGGNARGASAQPVVPAGHKNLLLQVDVTSPEPFPRYDLTVRDSRGKRLATKSVAASETENAVLLLLSELPAGSYEVVIEGVREDGKRSKITTRSFQVHR
jgi:hypothetical protein